MHLFHDIYRPNHSRRPVLFSNERAWLMTRSAVLDALDPIDMRVTRMVDDSRYVIHCRINDLPWRVL